MNTLLQTQKIRQKISEQYQQKKKRRIRQLQQRIHSCLPQFFGLPAPHLRAHSKEQFVKLASAAGNKTAKGSRKARKAKKAKTRRQRQATRRAQSKQFFRVKTQKGSSNFLVMYQDIYKNRNKRKRVKSSKVVSKMGLSGEELAPSRSEGVLPPV